MVLLVHMLSGAAIGSLLAKNIILAAFLAFLSHYFLDLFPHVEYDIQNISKRQTSERAKVVVKILADFLLGMLLITFFSNFEALKHPAFFICAFFAIIPDGLTVLNNLFPNKILQAHNFLHTQKIHFLKYKKIPIFWRFLSQIIAVIVSLLILAY